MYTPKHFAVQDTPALHAFMGRWSFATLVTIDGSVPFATPLPFLVKPQLGPYGLLQGHMAKANGQWHTFQEGHEALVIFQGPHAYISPSWYLDHPAVPTWNYTTVHAYGIPKIIADRTQARQIVAETVALHEQPLPQPWQMDSLPDEYVDKLLNGIVAFEIEITRLEGKWKLSQNRSAEDQSSVRAVLTQSTDGLEREVAEMMGALGADY